MTRLLTLKSSQVTNVFAGQPRYYNLTCKQVKPKGTEMTNTTNTTRELFNDYTRETATTAFALAYTEKSKPTPNAPVFVSIVPTAETVNYLITDRKSSSHGGGNVLRFKPTVTQKWDMYQRFGRFELATFERVCSVLDMLKEQAANGELMSAETGKAVNPKAINRGHAIEWLLCERWGLVWAFDNASHKTAGDITANGEEYQVKFQGASL